MAATRPHKTGRAFARVVKNFSPESFLCSIQKNVINAHGHL